MTSLALCVVLFSLANGRETPTFRWASESRSADGIPDLHVKFLDGTEDFIELHHYTPIELEKGQEAATFMGKLKNDQKSVVAVTGHPHSSDYHVSILRAHQNDITVRVNGEGQSTHIERIMENEFDFVLPPSISQKFSQSTPIDRQMPPNNYLRIVFGYTSSAIDHFGNLTALSTWLSQTITHLQAFYHHPTLLFSVTFDTPAPILDLTLNTSIIRAEGSSLDTARKVASEKLKNLGNAQQLTVFVRDKSGDGTVGLAFVGTICLGGNFHVSITEIQGSPLGTAKTAAHELGHNFGASHEQGSCKGLMYYTTDSGSFWSNCSDVYFQDYHNRVVSQTGSWCLKRDDPAGVGGSWAPWGPFNACTQVCGGTGQYSRSRICIGSNCPGINFETVSGCNPQACPICTDTALDCASKKSKNMCGSDFDNMKVTCKKTCNVDSNTVKCQEYLKAGYCDPNGVNYYVMKQICGASCGYFCP